MIGTSLSGLNAAQTRLGVSANNIANIRTISSPESEEKFTPSEVQQVSNGDKGGTSALIRPVSPPSVSEYNPSSALADDKGLVSAPNVSQENEVVNQIIGRSSFKANLAALDAYNKTTQSLLDIVG